MSITVYLTNQEVRAAVGKGSSRSVQLTQYCHCAVPPGSLLNGIITNEADLEDALRSFWAENKLPLKDVRLVLLSSHFSVRQMYIPFMNQAKTNEYAAHGFQHHENDEEHLYDVTILSRDKVSKLNDTLAVMVEKELVESFIALFKRIGVSLISIQPMRTTLISMLSGVGMLDGKTCIIQMLEGNELYSLLYVNGSYTYSTRTRAFAPRGTDAVGIHGKLENVPFPDEEKYIRELLLGMLDDRQKDALQRMEDVDFAMETPDGRRQRVNIYRQQGRLAAAIRLLNDKIPTMEELGLPKTLQELADQPRGLVLVTGPTGSGKSTTLASMVDYLNRSRPLHILTIEDPVEYRYEQGMSTIHQREVGRDIVSFASALRSALREDPDVILVGEMRDYETISAAVTAAETGHLVFSTLHTTGAAQTVDRIIDACPAGTQNQVRSQLSGVLKGVVSQCLVPKSNHQGRVVATEILVGTDAALNMIRENKSFQLGSVMQSGIAYGMHTLNADLARLAHRGLITEEMAFQYSNDKKDLQQFL